MSGFYGGSANGSSKDHEVVREIIHPDGTKTVYIRPGKSFNSNGTGYRWPGPIKECFELPKDAFTKYEDDNLL